MFFFFYNILLPIPRFLFGSIIEPFSKWQQRVNEQPIMFQLEVPYLLQPKWRPCVVYIDLLQVGALAAMFQCIMHLVMNFVSIAAIHLILINRTHHIILVWNITISVIVCVVLNSQEISSSSKWFVACLL